MLTDFTIRNLMRQAYKAALNSTDRSTANGTVLVDPEDGCVLVHGWNHHIDGYGDKEEHHERPLKYDVTEHAERDVIFKAAREGIHCEGLTMVGNWVACPPCARAIELAGISTVICHQACMARTPERWADGVNLGLEILKKGDVELIRWDGEVGLVENLNNGEIWYP